MKILITGSSGLVGLALVPFLTSGGHQVFRLVRSQARSDKNEISWNPDAEIIDLASIEGMDAVVHLAGENITAGRWTKARKERIRESRVHGTHFLAESLARLSRPPKVFASASAVGYYGDRDDEVLKETSSSGSGFLAEVCREWETATEAAGRTGIRIVTLRFGIILSPSGGALAKILHPFRLGLGGVIGSGQQYMSWIAIDDVAGAVYHVVRTGVLRGPVNIVTPNPVTNREFTETLAKVLSRPAKIPLPSIIARLAVGEMADALLLASARAVPEQLQISGYKFRYPRLGDALQHLLGK